MNLYIDIDETICRTPSDLPAPQKYMQSVPIMDRIQEINRKYDSGYYITYWTARGAASGVDCRAITLQQLAAWGCKYHSIRFDKPSFDLMIDDKCCCADAYQWTASSQIKQRPSIVEKGWGHELIIANNPDYCGKILYFNKGGTFSMHYHMKKKESWYVAGGSFLFKYIDTTCAEIRTQTLESGDIVTNERGQPHQLICQEAGAIFEVSTHHEDSDSYRIFKGDSQKVSS